MPILSAWCLWLALSAAAGSEELVEQGLDLRRKGEDAQALKLFEQAYAQEPSPRVLAQIALAHQALGHWVEAESKLLVALEQGGPWIEARREPLQQALLTIRERLATLEIRGKPDGASVVVDGTTVGTLPLAEPLRVRAGEVGVRVEADGYLPAARTVSLPPRGRARETFKLSRVPDAASGEGAPARAASDHGPTFGIVDARTLLIEAGFPRLPSATYRLPVASWFDIGFQGGFDVALFGATGDGLPGTLTFHGTVPLRLALVSEQVRARLTVAPGLGFTAINYAANAGVGGFARADQTGEFFALLLHASLDVGTAATGWLDVGGGIDVDTTLFYGGGTDAANQPEEFTVVPVLFGPTLGARLSKSIHMNLDLRLGPHITSGDLAILLNRAAGEDTRVLFGFRAGLGISVALPQ